MATKEEQSRIGKSNVRRSKTHERRVAALLAEWSGVPFRRRRTEGRDVLTVERDSTADVICVGKDCRFSIEAKCGQGFSLNALLADIKKNKFTGWWHQCSYDAQIMTECRNKNAIGEAEIIHPMLFFKPAPAHDWVAVSKRAFDWVLERRNEVDFQSCRPDAEDMRANPPHLYFDAYERYGGITDDVSHSKKHPKMVTMALEPVIMCRWHDFASHFVPQSIFF